MENNLDLYGHLFVYLGVSKWLITIIMKSEEQFYNDKIRRKRNQRNKKSYKKEDIQMSK